MRRPLLIVDGDSFAHRAYHALPKSIRRRGDKGAGAILGFANILLRFYDIEKPRAVLVGWDTYDAPTYRHEALASYQSGRTFDDELTEQLEVLPEFVKACGFTSAKKAGYEADDFVAAAAGREEKLGGTAIVASGDRDTYQLASERTTIVQPVRAGEVARIGPKEVRARYGVDPKQVPDFIALRGDASDRIPGASGVGAVTAAGILRKYGSLEEALAAGGSHARLRSCGCIAPSRPWTNGHPCPRSATKNLRGKRRPCLQGTGSSTNWPSAWKGSPASRCRTGRNSPSNATPARNASQRLGF
jgi:DNA polymerase-1